jgi:tRNA G46 methylase TrmB
MRLAHLCPEVLAIGVDTSADGLVEVSRRAARATRKGGLPNALFLVGDAAEALQALQGCVSEVRITLPWGALLRRVLLGEREFALAVGGSL